MRHPVQLGYFFIFLDEVYCYVRMYVRRDIFNKEKFDSPGLDFDSFSQCAFPKKY